MTPFAVDHSACVSWRREPVASVRLAEGREGATSDVIEALWIDPADAAADHWRHVHNCLLAGTAVQPRPAPGLARPAKTRIVNVCCTQALTAAATAFIGAAIGAKPVPPLRLERLRERADWTLRVPAPCQLIVTDLVVANPTEDWRAVAPEA